VNGTFDSKARWGLSPGGTRGLERAREGDVEAFGIVCLELEATLWRQGVMLCGDDAMAEDLVQDTLITSWRRLDRFDGSCRFSTWVTGILLNLHRNMARKNRMRLESPLPECKAGGENGSDDTMDWPGRNIVDPRISPAEQLQNEERNSLLRKCLARLPEEQRSVVQLRFLAGADIVEISSVLGCPEGTVKSRLFHALRKLAAMAELRDDFRGHNVELSL
jgi:RNA polymerase sigma-70 factor (ECF subfamily)